MGKFLRTAVIATIVPLALSACSGGDSGPTETVVIPAPTTVQKGMLVLLDVRTPDEFAAGHLQGATNIDVEDPSFADRIADLDKSGHYVVYCHSGRRSAIAVQALKDAGFTDVTDAGGIQEAASLFGIAIVTS